MLERRGVCYHVVVPGALVNYLEEFSFTSLIRDHLPGFITHLLEELTNDTSRAYSSVQFMGAHYGSLKYSIWLGSPTLRPCSELSAVVAEDLNDFLQLTLRRELRAQGRQLNLFILNTLQVIEQPDLLLL